MGRTRTTDYLITTTFANGAESLVRRTFDDFEFVQGKLVEERCGIIVPVLPNNKVGNKKDLFADDFVAQRQEGLQRFLQRTVVHTHLVDAPSLFPFFTASATDWKQIRESATVNSDLDGSRSGSQALNGTSAGAAGGSRSGADAAPEEGAVDDPNSIHIDAHAAMHATGTTNSNKPGPVRRWWAAKREQLALQKKDLTLEETPAEAKFFGNLTSYAEHLETCVRILSVDYKDVLVASETVATKYQTMGAAFSNLWGETELSNTSSSNMYQSIGTVWGSLSKRVQEQVPVNKRQLDGPLEDLILDVEALKAALIKRKAAAYDYTKKTQEGKALNDQMNKLRQAKDFSGQQDKYYALEDAIRQSDLSIEESKKRCAMVTERLKRDVERFRVEFHERMRRVLEVFHKQQAEFLQKQAKVWESALPSLAALETVRSALPEAPKAIAASCINLSYSTGGAKAIIESIPVNSSESYPVEEPLVEDLLLDLAAPPAAAPPPPPPVSPPTVSEMRISATSFDSVGIDSAPFEEDSGMAMGGEANTTTARPIMKSV